MDFRLIASDMDGTLLDSDGLIPDGFWEILSQLTALGIDFAPASGRQLATLRAQFNRPLSYIAENGAVVEHKDEIISKTTMNKDSVHRIIDASKGLVICHPECAYIEHNDEAFLEEVAKYYVSLTEVPDLHDAVTNDVIKVASFFPGDAENLVAPLLRRATPENKVIVSGAHWVDIMNPDTNKGNALQILRDTLGIRKEQVVAFGDYLNDFELLHEAGTSYAMAHAHPDILAIADNIAHDGVLKIIENLLGEN